MRFIFFFISFIIFSHNTFSQGIGKENYVELKKVENDLKIYTDSIINSTDWVQRFKSNELLIKGLVTSLKVPYSFNYKYDSLRLSKLYAPDSSFRIFTWQVMKDLTFYRQYGAIQMKTKDGSLNFFPLFDVSDFTNNPIDSVRDIHKWIGAIYYTIIEKKHNNKSYYTLLGRDDNTERTNKKWIDILTFDEAGNPQFGRNCFVYPTDGIKPAQPCYRFCLEFRKNAGVKLQYDEKLDEIIFDRLVSESNDLNTKSTLIPYGEYEGFKWQNGKWYYTAKPFDVEEIKEENDKKILPKSFLEKAAKSKKGRF